jgi:plastocyanin
MRWPSSTLLVIILLAGGCAATTEEPLSDSGSTETSVEDEASAPDDTDADEGSASDDPDVDDPGAETGEGDGASAAPSDGVRETDEPGDVEVDIRMFGFEDDVVEISVGETVTWTNQDATRHTVTAGVDGEPSDAFEVAFADRGDTASLTFDEPGEYHYFCAPHQFMTGTVVVTG